jgi:UDP-glucose 4-epimerase
MNVVITGKNGYIGSNLANFLRERGINAVTVGVREKISNDIFKNADVVVHCAAIVHSPQITDEKIYDDVNFKLSVKLAKLAKKSGVKHFIFLSTMSVYGINEGVITKSTPLKPTTPYGKSKLKAEEELKKIADDNFALTIVRPPMVYGKGCGGNYNTLRKLALLSPVFPDTQNKKSMIYSDNLSQCLFEIITKKICGVILPKNKFDVNTAYMAVQIAKANGKKTKSCKFCGKLIKLLPLKTVKKAFGNLTYSDDIAYICDFTDFETSIIQTEK